MENLVLPIKGPGVRQVLWTMSGLWIFTGLWAWISQDWGRDHWGEMEEDFDLLLAMQGLEHRNTPVPGWYKTNSSGPR